MKLPIMSCALTACATHYIQARTQQFSFDSHVKLHLTMSVNLLTGCTVGTLMLSCHFQQIMATHKLLLPD